MFPSFKNLAERKAKEEALLDKAKRHVHQNELKRQMYAEAVWGSESNPTIKKLIPDTKSTETQTDMSMVDPKKKASELNEVGIQANEGVPILVDSGINTDKVATSDSGINTETVPTSDSGINTEGIPNSDASTPTEEEISQRRAKNEVRKWFKLHPDWKFIKIRPIKLNGERANDFYIGDNGDVYRIRTNKKTKSNIVNVIDWERTDDVIKDIYYDEQSDSIDEIDSMRLEDTQMAKRNRYDKFKRKGSFKDDRDSKKQIYDTIVYDKYTQSSHDQINAYAKIMILMRTYKDQLGSFVLYPETVDGFKFDLGKTKLDYSIRFSPDESKLIVVSNETKRPIPSVRDVIDWQDTLEEFFRIAEKRGVNFTHWRDKSLTGNPDRFKSNANGKASDGVQTGMDITKLDTKSMADSEAKQIIHDYFKALTEYGLEIPFRLNPIVLTKTGQKIDTAKYFGNPEGNIYLQLRTNTQKGHPKLSPSKNVAVLKSIKWADTLDSLLAGLGELYRLEQDPDAGLDGEAMSDIRRTLTTFERVVRDKNISIRDPFSIDDRFGLGLNTFGRVADAVSRPCRSSERQLNSHLTGRGLKGSGKSQYQTVERRGKYYNLNDIRGTGLASAYVYQPIGSKYIRIPDLENNLLNIVYPSRKKLGPKREISDGIKNMLKDLIYDDKLSQDAYDKLSIEDKRLFKEILQSTHINNLFKDQLANPFESIRAEYDKLKGQLMLGNNNPSVVNQMKSLLVDMYANHLISEKEFKDSIMSLI